MAYHELMIAGTGGRGVLLIGRLLARAGMKQYEHILFFPNYAPAMRGGESECTVILSDDPISSPVMFEPSYAIAMTGSAMALMEKRVKAGVALMIDSSVTSDKISRDDIEAFYIPASQKAVEVGGGQAANMVFLGAYAANTGAIELDFVEEALDDMLQDKSKDTILALNKKAFRDGATLMADYQ